MQTTKARATRIPLNTYGEFKSSERVSIPYSICVTHSVISHEESDVKHHGTNNPSVTLADVGYPVYGFIAPKTLNYLLSIEFVILLRLTASDYPFVIFKCFLKNKLEHKYIALV
jgi:hypothetical protein